MKIWRGQYNKSKIKILLYLNSNDSRNPMTAAQIFATVGVPYSSIVSSLSRFYDWEYVGRQRNSWGIYRYWIRPKGRRFLKNAPWHLNMNSIISEIVEFQKLTRKVVIRVGTSSAKNLVRAINEFLENRK